MKNEKHLRINIPRAIRKIEIQYPRSYARLCRFHNQHTIEAMEVQAAKASGSQNIIVTTH